MTNELVTLLGDHEVGRLRRDRNGRVSFQYERAWQNAPNAYPLSLSMPLGLDQHGHAIVDAFLWGLLPDNELIVQRWARRFQVSPRNAFALLGYVGEDCAGAVRLVPPERAGGLLREGAGTVAWLDEAELARRLRMLRSDAAAWRTETDSGQFSLAGAQPKTALFFDGRRWGVPSGRIPTTHILKPGAPSLDGHAENEHFCLELARALGLPVASSRVARFEDEVAIVVARYDRVKTRAGLLRVHQEDACQALGVHPARKYESDGGPGARAIVELLREHSRAPEEDVETFVGALAYGWLVAGTDAHAKNYSLLIGAEGRARLAPLYDVASALPYDALRLRKLKLAMKVGGKYRLYEIGRYEWSKLASELALDPEGVRTRIVRMARALPDLASDLRRRLSAEGLAHVAIERLASATAERGKRCAALLGG